MARDDYWTRRALADEAAAERLARQAAKEMRRVYREQYEAVLREIEGLMAEVAEGGTPTRTQLWNYARWRRLEERLREFAGEASRRCEQTVTDCLDEVFRTVIGADIANMTGTVWQASISPKAVLETAWSGEHYSARIWRNTAAIAGRVRDDVTDMIVQGKGISQVRRKLMEDFSVAYSDASRLVRTEAAYVRNQAALTRYRQNGRRKVRWITGKSDGRECAVCRERDGQEYDIDAAPRLPAHPNCRCCYAPVVETGLTEKEGDISAESEMLSGLQNANSDDIMRLNRRIVVLGKSIRPMSKKRLQKIVKAFRRRGGVIQMDAETDAYLKMQGAYAEAISEDIILLGRNPSRAAVFEELIHTAQFRSGKIDSTVQSRVRCEIEAKEKLIRYSKAYGLTDVEVEETRIMLEQYRKLLE